MSLRVLSVLLTLSLAACNGETTKPDTDTEPDTDTDVPEDTEETGIVDNGFIPVAVGLELEGAVTSLGQLAPYVDYNGDTIAPLLIMTFASKTFFTTGDDNESCFALARFEPKAALAIPDHFGTLDGEVLNEAYEVALPLDITASDCGGKVSTVEYGADAADLLTPWVGARIGYGWAALDPAGDLYSTLGTATTGDPDILGALFGQYFALNDAKGNFLGGARSIGIAFGYDEKTQDLLLDPKDKTLLRRLDVANSLAGIPDGVGSLGPAYFRSTPIFYPTLAALADDLTAGAP